MHSRERTATIIVAVSILVALGVQSLVAADAPAAITLVSPMPYAVFQRSNANMAKVLIAGRTAVQAATVEASVALMAPYKSGIDGKPVEFASIAKPTDLGFSGTLEVPAGGWYELTVRAKDAAGNVVAQGGVQKVGVGEVLIAAGHSFCSAHNGDAPSKAKDDRVSTCADWSGAAPKALVFRHGDDPLRPANGDHASPWPTTADVLVARLHVPVLIINTGIGGATVGEWLASADHQPPTGRCYPPFQLMLKRIVPYTGLRAVIWFGNENDLWRGPTADQFSSELTKLIAHSRTDAGYAELPWVIAFDACFPDVAKRLGPAEKQKRKDQLDRGTQIVIEKVPFTYEGPQTDDLGPDFRKADGDHFNEAGIEQLGHRFARKIEQSLFPPAPPMPRGPQ